MAKIDELGTESIFKLLLRYSLPAIVAMVVNAIYNIVDRIFIGVFAGEDALAGLTITFPVMMIVFAFATLIGIGGNALFSIKLGEKDERGAGRVFGNTMGLCVISAVMAFIILFFNLESLLRLFGATPAILGYSMDYMEIILAGFIFQMISFSFINSIRNEGAPMLPMVSMIASAVTNTILDYVFIAVFRWGVQGAAFATVLGQVVGFAILISFYLRGKSMVRVTLKDFIPNWSLTKDTFTVGFASFAGTVGASVALIFLNHGFGQYGGNQAIASMGAVNSLFTICMMPLMGIQQGMLPIIGYNYGAGFKKRTWNALGLAMAASVFFSTTVFFILESLAPQAVTLFLDSASPTVGVAATGLRLYLISLPVVSINLLGVAFFQSTADGAKSLVFGMLRQFIFLIPAALLLPRIWGLPGVWIATPVADILAVTATAFALIAEYRGDKIDKSQVLLTASSLCH